LKVLPLIRCFGKKESPTLLVVLRRVKEGKRGIKRADQRGIFLSIIV